MLRKIDKYYRLNVPRDMLRSIGLNPGDEVEVSLNNNNEIILSIPKNEPEEELEEPEVEPEIKIIEEQNPIESLVEDNKDRLSSIFKMLDNIPETKGLAKYKSNDVISIRPKGNPYEEYQCDRCGNSTLGSRFTLNDKPICLTCFRDIKTQIIEEAKNGK